MNISEHRRLEERVRYLEKVFHSHLGPKFAESTPQIPHPMHLMIKDIDDTPVNGELAAPISSNWAFDHGAAADPHAGYLKESDFDDIDFLVGTATGHTAAEIVVGTSPGGELGGTWASPTVDATHSGSTHASKLDLPTWTAYSYSGTDFTASGGGTWAVDAGDVFAGSYTILNKLMFVNIHVNSTDVNGGPAALQFLIPAGKTATRRFEFLARIIDAGVGSTGFVITNASSTVIQILRLDGAAWTNTSGDNTAVQFSIFFEIN